ncbi:MAG: hypothetical protein HC884_20020 [Chloroflexaceae bacterium]|nr:hypothetical protein [Chloroflexaceae bacterium]
MSGTEGDRTIICPHCRTPQKQPGQQLCDHCGKPLSPRRFDYQEPGTGAGTGASGGSHDSPPAPGDRRFDYQGPSAGGAWQGVGVPPALPVPARPGQSKRPTAMSKTPKRISVGMFGAILLCFFLPFVTFSCGSREINLNGVDLLTGGAGIQANDLEEIPTSVLIPSVVVGVALVVGLVGSFFPQVAATAISAISGVAGVAGLFLFKAALTDTVEKPSDEPSGLLDTVGNVLKSTGLLKVEYNIGFWLVLALFLGAAVLNAVLLAIHGYRER